MKRLFVVLAFLSGMSLAAQERDLFDIDIDSLFDEPPPEIPAEETAGLSALSLVRRRGFTFSASYDFAAGFAPGWSEAPWFPAENRAFSWAPAAKMRAEFDLDSQLSEVFRVKSAVYFAIPEFEIKLGDFFFDYSLYDAVFIRAGKYSLSWGISPNYGFTNLPSRVPNKGAWGDSFILKADIPLGVGGFQFLAMTRALLLEGVKPGLPDFGFGGKYNLALRWLDLDFGVFYQKAMPLRSFLSLKTTIGNTELYSEGLVAIDIDKPAATSGAVNLGFARNFFDGRLTVNAELFYNAERDSFWYSPGTTVEEAKFSDLVEGFSGALNLLYRFSGRGSPRAFIQTYYAPQENSARLVPGFRLSPWPNVEFYLAVPMALGSKDGYYYTRTDLRDLERPFSIVFLLTFSGGVQFGHYY